MLHRLYGSDRFWDVAIQREDYAHELVTQIGGGIEHARATAVDHRDAVLPSVVGRRFGDAAGAGTAVHPDMLDPEPGALAHRLLGDLWARSYYDRLDVARDRAQVVIAGVTFNLLRVRVDGERLVSSLPKASINNIASVVLGVSRDPGHSHPPAGQELGRGLLDRWHILLLSRSYDTLVTWSRIFETYLPYSPKCLEDKFSEVGLLSYSSCIHRCWLGCERGRAICRGSFPLLVFPAPLSYTPTLGNSYS